MKAWDTNLLVRHMTEDDPAQTRIVRAALAKASRSGKRVWLSDITIVETFWVLCHVSGLSRDDALTSLETVAADARFLCQSGADLSEAIRRTRKAGDLPEHLIALGARRAGASHTQTFDKAVKGFSEFELLGAET